MGICRWQSTAKLHHPDHRFFSQENCEWLGVPPFWKTPHVPAMELWRVSQHFKHPNVNTKYIKNTGISGCSSLQHHVLYKGWAPNHVITYKHGDFPCQTVELPEDTLNLRWSLGISIMQKLKMFQSSNLLALSDGNYSPIIIQYFHIIIP